MMGTKAAEKPKKLSSLSWVPVRRGLIYCSPACGHLCTFAEYRFAIQQAEDLSRRLGMRWKPRVWENLGWHWSVESVDGYLKLHPDNSNRQPKYFNAFLGIGGGGRWTATAKTPQEAVKRVVAQANLEVENLTGLIRSASLSIPR